MKQNKAKAIFAASIGNALEWYDFSIFAFFASYIAKNFFIDNDPQVALVNTFILFGTGFLARPLGALVIGIYGDKMGRKAALTLTISLMAIGTFIILVSPSFQYIGIFAPILLLIARLFQGFSTGGEIGGAAAFLIEYAPKDKKVLYTSFLQASMGFSNILAAIIGILLTSFFTENEILEYAWRFAFLFGLLIVPVGFYIRKTLNETPEFLHFKQEVTQNHNPLKEIYKHHLPKIFFGILFSILWTSCIYTFIIYMPTYYKNVEIGLGFSSNQSFWASFVGNIFLVSGFVYFAYLSSKIGTYKLIFIGIILLATLPFFLLYCLFSYPNFYVLVFVHIVLCTLVSIFGGIAPAILANYYPTQIRSTALAVSYNIAAIFFAGFTPAIVNYLIGFEKFAPAYWVLFACCFGLIATIVMKKSEYMKELR